MLGRVLVVATLGVAFASYAAELQEADIDRLCPPRPETAAKFRAGGYPPAVRPYREAARLTYRYMTSLRAMTALVETGKPDQKYQHNAYVSKTHAAHVTAMLDWMRFEPEARETAMRFAKASAEFLLGELEPADAPLAFWPPTYGRKPLEFDPKTDGPYDKPCMVGNEPEGAVKYRGEVMLVYPATVGSAFVDYWRETKDGRFLTAAVGIAETYLKTRRADGSWPLKMKLATGEMVGENTLVPTRPLNFFEKLFDVTGDLKWRVAADACFAWLEAHPLKDWNWDGQFEDSKPEKPYINPTKHNAVDTMLYILKRFPGDKARIATCRRILDFCEKRFSVWEPPQNYPNWSVPSVLEQYSCFTPIDASATKMILGYLAMYHAEGRTDDLAKARALADMLTRVQKSSGRIPTFWEGVRLNDAGLSNERYDWLNCMAASAKVLVKMSEVDSVPHEKGKGMLLMNEDCFHYFIIQGPEGDGQSEVDTIGCVGGPEFDLTEKGLERYVDEIARGKVTHFLMNLNGSMAMFPSKAFEPVWNSMDNLALNHPKWIALLKDAYDRGIDPYAVWIRRCREKGVKPWISIRMNDVHVAVHPKCAFISEFWRRHPEWRVNPARQYGSNEWYECALNDGLDYSVPEVRNRMLAFLKEVLERYDPDGLELDMIRGTRYLPVGREAETAPVMTEFMREARKLARTASARRGHEIVLAVRLLTRPEESLKRGLRADVWADEGLIDAVIPCNFWASIDFDIPIAEWKRWTKGRVRVYAGADSGVVDAKGRRLATYAEYLAWAKACRKNGADGLYLFNLFVHPRETTWKSVLTEGLLGFEN